MEHKHCINGIKPINLYDLGLSTTIEKLTNEYPGFYPGRISQQHRDIYHVYCEAGEITAKVSGKYLYKVSDPTQYPVVGDWVMLDRADDTEGLGIIHHLLPRTSLLERKASGTSGAVQGIAANMDTVFICMALNQDYNLRRLERYLALAWSSGATPVVLLTKSDLCENIEDKIAEVSAIAIGVEILSVSSLSKDGLALVQAYIQSGKTIIFLGSSGVGKSTLANLLAGEELLATNGLRNDGKGKHTTTHRQMVLLQNGGILIDTPGMRELQLESGNLDKSFEDVKTLEAQCKFSDCSHTSEPGCAVRKALEAGILPLERFNNYLKLQKEIQYEGMNSKQIEEEKINRMFGGKKQLKQFEKSLKHHK